MASFVIGSATHVRRNLIIFWNSLDFYALSYDEW